MRDAEWHFKYQTVVDPDTKTCCRATTPPKDVAVSVSSCVGGHPTSHSWSAPDVSVDYRLFASAADTTVDRVFRLGVDNWSTNEMVEFVCARQHHSASALQQMPRDELRMLARNVDYEKTPSFYTIDPNRDREEAAKANDVRQRMTLFTAVGFESSSPWVRDASDERWLDAAIVSEEFIVDFFVRGQPSDRGIAFRGGAAARLEHGSLIAYHKETECVVRWRQDDDMTDLYWCFIPSSVKSECVYNVCVAIVSRYRTVDVGTRTACGIKSFYCECTAGLGGCKHVAAVLYRAMVVVDDARTATCTGRPQGWHRPRGLAADQFSGDPLQWYLGEVDNRAPKAIKCGRKNAAKALALKMGTGLVSPMNKSKTKKETPAAKGKQAPHSIGKKVSARATALKREGARRGGQ